jgi:hypothetical protein
MADIKKLKNEVKKAYYEGKIVQLLSRLQAENYEETVFEKVKKWLGIFKKEDEKRVEEFSEFIPKEKDEQTAPRLDELLKPLSKEEEIKVSKWLEEMDKNMDDCIKLAREQRDRVSSGKHINSKKLLDLGLFFITNEFSFNQVLAYRERLYKAKIIYIIDSYNISRREAQDRAEITKEYFEYKVMKKNMDTFNELEMYAKKYNQTF